MRTPDRTLVVDHGGRLAGRGAYVCRDGSCLDVALARGGLSRALEIPIPKDLHVALRSAAATTPQMTQGGARGEE